MVHGVHDAGGAGAAAGGVFAFFQNLFRADFIPRSHCVHEQTGIILLHVISDALIASAYFSIPIALLLFIHRRRDVVFNWMFAMFAAFILFCGLTHLLGILMFWVPVYRLDGVVKLATGVVSAATAVMLWPLIPRALLLPSPEQMRQKNIELERQIRERERAEEELRLAHSLLEQRVRERTAELARVNDELRAAIEERRHAQEDLLRHAQQLARSNADLEDFAYIASHDLKEPLRGISNYTTFILEDHGSSLDEGGRDKVRTIQRLAQRLYNLLDSVLEYSRLGRTDLSFEPVDLSVVVSDAIDSLGPWLEGQGGRVAVVSPLPVVHCDSVRVGQIFSNLIANGVKYNDHAEKHVEIGANPPPNGGPPVIFVRDDGIGIRPQFKETVFRMFKRLHARDNYGGGTGAGLALVKKIVERHGGRIWIESEPGQGTTVYFTLAPDAEAVSPSIQPRH
jgi:signal transduction histidine kinase